MSNVNRQGGRGINNTQGRGRGRGRNILQGVSNLFRRNRNQERPEQQETIQIGWEHPSNVQPTIRGNLTRYNSTHAVVGDDDAAAARAREEAQGLGHSTQTTLERSDSMMVVVDPREAARAEARAQLRTQAAATTQQPQPHGLVYDEYGLPQINIDHVTIKDVKDLLHEVLNHSTLGNDDKEIPSVYYNLFYEPIDNFLGKGVVEHQENIVGFSKAISLVNSKMNTIAEERDVHSGKIVSDDDNVKLLNLFKDLISHVNQFNQYDNLTSGNNPLNIDIASIHTQENPSKEALDSHHNDNKAFLDELDSRTRQELEQEQIRQRADLEALGVQFR